MRSRTSSTGTRTILGSDVMRSSAREISGMPQHTWKGDHQAQKANAQETQPKVLSDWLLPQGSGQKIYGNRSSFNLCIGLYCVFWKGVKVLGGVKIVKCVGLGTVRTPPVC